MEEALENQARDFNEKLKNQKDELMNNMGSLVQKMVADLNN